MNDKNKKDRFKHAGESFLKGLAAVGTALSDGPARSRIREIDHEMKQLQNERDYLVDHLVQPLPDEKVSENYVPGSYYPEPPVRVSTYSTGEGRLVQCKGRSTSSRYHQAHPGCPYVEQIHIAHDFMLRD